MRPALTISDLFTTHLNSIPRFLHLFNNTLSDSGIENVSLTTFNGLFFTEHKLFSSISSSFSRKISSAVASLLSILEFLALTDSLSSFKLILRESDNFFFIGTVVVNYNNIINYINIKYSSSKYRRLPISSPQTETAFQFRNTEVLQYAQNFFIKTDIGLTHISD